MAAITWQNVNPVSNRDAMYGLSAAGESFNNAGASFDKAIQQRNAAEQAGIDRVDLAGTNEFKMLLANAKTPAEVAALQSQLNSISGRLSAAAQSKLIGSEGMREEAILGQQDNATARETAASIEADRKLLAPVQLAEVQGRTTATISNAETNERNAATNEANAFEARLTNQGKIATDLSAKLAEIKENNVGSATAATAYDKVIKGLFPKDEGNVQNMNTALALALEGPNRERYKTLPYSAVVEAINKHSKDVGAWTRNKSVAADIIKTLDAALLNNGDYAQKQEVLNSSLGAQLTQANMLQQESLAKAYPGLSKQLEEGIARRQQAAKDKLAAETTAKENEKALKDVVKVAPKEATPNSQMSNPIGANRQALNFNRNSIPVDTNAPIGRRNANTPEVLAAQADARLNKAKAEQDLAERIKAVDERAKALLETGNLAEVKNLISSPEFNALSPALKGKLFRAVNNK